ncbi:oligosaccharide flippase family protein, partial [Bacteroides rodentium]
MSIKNQAAKGVMWNAIERFSSQGIQFVLTIVIARLLSPGDYGLIAMLGIFMEIAQTMVDRGI